MLGTRGTETSKYPEEKKEKTFSERKLDFLSSGERKGKSLNHGIYPVGLWTAISKPYVRRMVLGKPARESESLVFENRLVASRIRSTTRHEKPCRKSGGPPPKAKYYLVTDSA